MLVPAAMPAHPGCMRMRSRRGSSAVDLERDTLVSRSAWSGSWQADGPSAVIRAPRASELVVLVEHDDIADVA